MSSKKNSRLWDDDQRNYWTESWDKSPFTLEEKILHLTKSNKILPSIIKYTSKGAKILEAGCGMGQWVIALDKMGYDITGLDFSEPTIKKLKAEHPHLKFVVGDVTNFEFQEGSFDAMLSWGVIEHFEEGPGRALSEAHRILSKDGILFVTVPCKNILHIVFSPLLYIKEKLRKNKIIRKFRNKKNLKVNFYQHEFRRNVFSKYVLDAGFEIIRIAPINPERGFVKYINKLLRTSQNSRKFLQKNSDRWSGEVNLTKAGNFLYSLLNKISPWITPHMIYVVARKI